MEEHLFSALSMELFLPEDHIPESIPPKLQLEAARKVGKQHTARLALLGHGQLSACRLCVQRRFPGATCGTQSLHAGIAGPARTACHTRASVLCTHACLCSRAFCTLCVFSCVRVRAWLAWTGASEGGGISGGRFLRISSRQYPRGSALPGVCGYVCVYVCMYQMYVCVCLYVHTHTHTYTHTHTHTQGRALNHWRHFFCNLCITLQLAQPNPPAGTAEEMWGGGGEGGGRQPARTARKNQNRDDENWDQLYSQVNSEIFLFYF
jgi:hypothetical protein